MVQFAVLGEDAASRAEDALPSPKLDNLAVPVEVDPDDVDDPAPKSVRSAAALSGVTLNVSGSKSQ